MNREGCILDTEIMNVFEEEEEKFSFPLSNQKDARDFVKFLNKRGCSYEIISREVNEDGEKFRDWRLGKEAAEIGKNVIERINRPFRDTMFSETDFDEKNHRNSLKDFYKFSFDEDEFVSKLSTRDTKKVENVRSSTSSAAINSSNLPADKSKSNLPPSSSQQEKPETLKSPTNLTAAMSSSQDKKPAPSKTSEVEKTIGEDRDSKVASIPTKEKTAPVIPASKENKLADSSKTQNLNEKPSSQPSTDKRPDSKPSSLSSPAPEKVTIPNVQRETSSSSSSSSSKLSSVSPKSAAPTISLASPSTKPTIPLASPPTATSPAISKPSGSTTTAEKEEERPPSPVTTSPHYQPSNATFTLEEMELMLNYNSDDQASKTKTVDSDGAGYVFVFSDIPGPTMKATKSTKFRVKVGVSRDPTKRLKQALLFNPDIRMIASIPIKSRKSCRATLKEKLKPLTVKNKVDWYWGTLNATFAAIDVALSTGS